jgi:DNA polymerase-3 subunit delta
MAARAQGAGYELLAGELKKGTLHPAYLLWGEERFLTSRAEGEIVRAALGEGGGDAFSLARYDAATGALGEAIASANELPMLASRRVVVFRGITVRDALGNAKVPARKPEREALKAYLDAPNPTTVLVLTGEVVDQRQRFLTGAKHLRIYEMRAPSPARLVKWVMGKATSCGFTLSQEAAAELVERVGVTMTALSVEIEKLALYVDEGATAEVADVAALSEGGSGASVYEISEAIARGDLACAVRVLRRIVELHTDGESRAMSELRRSFALWLRIRQGLDAGESPAALASALRLPAFIVRKNTAGARRFDTATLVELVGRVVELERRMKLGGGGIDADLELLVARAALPPQRAAV